MTEFLIGFWLFALRKRVDLRNKPSGAEKKEVLRVDDIGAGDSI
jgi:hypothetical protein